MSKGVFITAFKPIIFEDTTVIDDALTLDSLVSNNAPVRITKGMEIQVGNSVYSYDGEDFTPSTFDSSSDLHNVGDIVFDGGAIKVISGKGATVTTPKEPEEYGTYATSVDPSTWGSNYYIRIPDGRDVNSGDFVSSMWIIGTRWYYIFFEDRPHHPNCGYRFSAKDLTANAPRGPEDYLRFCMGVNTTTSYTVAKDIPASIVSWASPSKTPVSTVQIKSLIIRAGYMYLRTNVGTKQYQTQVGAYTLSHVSSPLDIAGFIYKRRVVGLLPFDGRNDTICRVPTEFNTASWTFTSSEPFDAVVLGSVSADTVRIQIRDTDGIEVYDNTKIVSRFASVKTLTNYKRVVFDYFNDMGSEYSITVTLSGSNLGLGELYCGSTYQIGLMDVNYSNEKRPIRKSTVDDFGKYVYKTGSIIRILKGNISMRVEHYDEFDELLLSIGERPLFFNGSGNTTLVNGHPEQKESNSVDISESTMVIGYIDNLVGKRTDLAGTHNPIVKASFTIEELV